MPSTISKALREADAAQRDAEQATVAEEVNLDDTEADMQYEVGSFVPGAVSATTRTYDAVVTDLTQPIDRSDVKTRKGQGNKTLAYLDTQTVITNLNRIFGFGNWQTSIDELTDLGTTGEGGVPRAVRARVTLTVDFPKTDDDKYSRTASFEDVGYKTLRTSDWGGYEMAVKGAVSDAIKRCAKNLGNQFGLSLYADPEEGTPVPSAAGGSGATTMAPAASGYTTAATMNGNRTATGPACEECGRPITAYHNPRSNRDYTAEQMAEYSRRDCDGHVLCFDHKNEYKLRASGK